MAIQKTKVYAFENDSPISGHVEVKIPTYPERLRMLGKLRFKVDKESNTVVNDDAQGLDRIASSIEMLEGFIVKVDCEIKENKEKIETFHDLCMFAECQDILVKASTELIQGISLGKS